MAHDLSVGIDQAPGAGPPVDPTLPFEPVSCELEISSERSGVATVRWNVELSPGDHGIRRSVTRDGLAIDSKADGWDPDPVIWPTWFTVDTDDSAAPRTPLRGVQRYWESAGDRMRDSAKWLATVLGAALATVVGTTPLSHLYGHLTTPVSVLGFAGLVLLGGTLILVLRVLQPQSVSFADVQLATRKPLEKWRRIVEEQADLYLPPGIHDLTGLRQAMIVEEITLKALALARNSVRDEAAGHLLVEAQTARAARLHEYRIAAGRITSVGEYQALQHRSAFATYGGVILGILGTASIVGAFLLPMR